MAGKSQDTAMNIHFCISSYLLAPGEGCGLCLGTQKKPAMKFVVALFGEFACSVVTLMN